MQISMWVPYDHERQRRAVKFLLRSQLNIARATGASIVVLGILFHVLKISTPMAAFLLIVGAFWAVALPPLVVAETLRKQSGLVKDGWRIILDDEGVTTIHPLVESRIRWAALSRVVETPEVWYLVLSKLSALTIPKAVMTEDQRATFGEYARGLRPVEK
ncbi:YcxB family protein [Nocardia sp. CA-128927]|uniref:YcxB family protein n=1 Tax=Nocardia sp. CA-128927 TaxID=3239975 RepID=UPI003D98B54B